MRSIEESYSIRNAEHKAGTNRYVFKFNEAWRQITNQQLTIAVRSIKLWYQSRLIGFNGLMLNVPNDSNEIEQKHVGLMAILEGSNCSINDQLKLDVHMHCEHYNLKPLDYEIYYNPSSRKLVFSALNDNYFTIDSDRFEVTSDFKKFVGIEDDDFWNQLKTGVEDLDNQTCKKYGVELVRNQSGSTVIDDPLTHYDPDEPEEEEETTPTGHVTSIIFKNINSRSNLRINASFVDLAYDNYLGVTNEEFAPAKQYPIIFQDQKFWIDLYDLNGNAVELADDDELILEVMLLSS